MVVDHGLFGVMRRLECVIEAAGGQLHRPVRTLDDSSISAVSRKAEMHASLLLKVYGNHTIKQILHHAQRSLPFPFPAAGNKSLPFPVFSISFGSYPDGSAFLCKLFHS